MSLPLWDIGNDDAMRLVQVRDLLAGQSWFDVTQYRLGLETGTPMHCSRLIDLPIDVTIYALATFMWVFVLPSVPLLLAYSFMVLTFVIVPILSALLLGEVITIRNFIGATLIIGGLMVVTTGG